MTTLVTPCQHEHVPSGSQSTWASMWVWPSMKPGVTTWPSASISSAAPLADPADGGDAAPAHTDVGAVARQPRTVDDQAIPNNQIKRHLSLRRIVDTSPTLRSTIVIPVQSLASVHLPAAISATCWQRI